MGTSPNLKSEAKSNFYHQLEYSRMKKLVWRRVFWRSERQYFQSKHVMISLVGKACVDFCNVLPKLKISKECIERLRRIMKWNNASPLVKRLLRPSDVEDRWDGWIQCRCSRRKRPRLKFDFVVKKSNLSNSTQSLNEFYTEQQFFVRLSFTK